MTTDLRERQIALEEEMVTLGERKFDSDWSKALKRRTPEDTAYGQAFTRHCVGGVLEQLEAITSETRKGKAGKGATAVSKLKQVDNMTAAYLACKGAFHCLISASKYTYACKLVGMMIEDEAWLRAFERHHQDHKRHLRNAQKGIERRGVRSRHNKRENYKRAVRNSKGFDWKPWSDRDRIRVGDLLLELFKDSGFFSIEMLPHKPGRPRSAHYIIKPSDKLAEWLRDGKVKGELLRPQRLPMLVPPQRRTGRTLVGSGYISHYVKETPVVKHARRVHRSALSTSDLMIPRTALEILDNTPRRVNAPVLAVLKDVWARGWTVGDMPSSDPIPLPKKPRGIEKMRKDNPKLLAYRTEAKRVHEANHRLISKKLMVERVIEIADKFKDEPAIYFPHDVDFRGRVYDIPTGLNPQGPDYSRGLLTFAYGKPVRTQEAMRWLMIHGANTWGNDKVSFDERVQWVADHYEDIKAVTEDPLRSLWWTEADKPFCFLAWCFDYIGVVDEDKDSFIPIAMDGSCNGLQHLSAMLLDPVGGAAVNLLPSEKPNDIYQEVADRVTQKLLAMPGQWIAETWLSFGINRKMTKRATMVMPYGGTMMATLKYVEEAYLEQLGANPSPFGEQEREACVFIAKQVHVAIREVVIKADEAMKWLQTCAGVFAKANKPLVWTTPTGLRCAQEYKEETSLQVTTKLNGNFKFPRKQLRVYEDGDKMDKSRMRSAFSPNFVHSMDAAALMQTVVAAEERGVSAFEMVHDSYGTHAADTEVLAETLRDAFVAIYKGGHVLTALREELVAQLPQEFARLIPEVPQCGSLDIEEVRHSEFFFA